MTYNITLGNVVLYGDNPPGGVGFAIQPEGVAGLNGGVSFRRDELGRLASHGVFGGDGMLESRTVTVKGYVFARSLDELWHLCQVLEGIGGAGKELSLSVDDFLGVRGNRAFLASTPSTRPKRRSLIAEFTIHLWMPDPLLYGDLHVTESSGAVVQASHGGNTDALQRFTVAGGCPGGYSLTGQGVTFSVPGPLAAGQTDEVDFRTGVVKRNGVTVAGVVPRTWTVPGGASVGWAFAPNGAGAGTATSRLHDTWI